MKHANISIFVPHVGCPNQCSFCNQKSISGQLVPVTPQEVADICRQAADRLQDRRGKTEIAFFGGSFTAIGQEQMVSLLQAAAPFVGENGFHGIRVSTRPDAVDEQRLELLKQYGVTAIELGVQSMDNCVLQLNRRGHTAEDVRNAVKLIRRYPFELGLQMMPGLYGDKAWGAVATAAELAALKPDTVRIYPTVVIRGTYLETLYQKGLYRPLALSEAVNLCADLLRYFEEQDIRVIRLGLHASKTLEDDYLAGPYHPAFRQLCESALILKEIICKLEELMLPKGEITIVTSPKNISNVAGHKQSGITALKAMGYTVKITGSDRLTGRQFIIKGK